MRNIVMITGVNGQDGSYLVEKYLGKGCKVIGVDRWYPTGTSPNLYECINHENFLYITGDICEKHFMEELIKKYTPDYFYHMAAISMVPESFHIPITVLQTNTMAVVNILEAIRFYSPHTRFLQASTSEQIGANKTTPQNTQSRMIPTSPYAVSKLASYHMVRIYRNVFKLFAVNALSWNHESERRGPDFVTRKISMGVAKISKGIQREIILGNLDSRRDWGYAPEYMNAMILMMHAKEPDDYALATNESHSIREFVEEAFSVIGKKIKWVGSGVHEKGIDQYGVVRVKISKDFYRPAEVEFLCGDAGKIKKALGWEAKTKFKDLVRKMVGADLDR